MYPAVHNTVIVGEVVGAESMGMYQPLTCSFLTSRYIDNSYCYLITAGSVRRRRTTWATACWATPTRWTWTTPPTSSPLTPRPALIPDLSGTCSTWGPAAGIQFNRNFCAWALAWIRFDSVAHLKYPLRNLESQLKTQAVFQANIQAKFFPLNRSPGAASREAPSLSGEGLTAFWRAAAASCRRGRVSDGTMDHSLREREKERERERARALTKWDP